jgi:hypothetical protein
MMYVYSKHDIHVYIYIYLCLIIPIYIYIRICIYICVCVLQLLNETAHDGVERQQQYTRITKPVWTWIFHYKAKVAPKLFTMELTNYQVIWQSATESHQWALDYFSLQPVRLPEALARPGKHSGAKEQWPQVDTPGVSVMWSLLVYDELAMKLLRHRQIWSYLAERKGTNTHTNIYIYMNEYIYILYTCII